MCFLYNNFYYKCGKCPECLQDIRREWSTRLQLHYEYSGEIPFFAHLTYDNDHVPVTENGNLTLSKRDIQLFLKRLRQNLKRYYDKNKISSFPSVKYYISGEYGPRGTHRPHYHIVIFGLPKSFKANEARAFISSAWQNGDVRKKSSWLVSPAQLHYVTKYMINYYDWKYDDRQEPFRMLSAGIGLPFVIYAKEHNLFPLDIQHKFICKYAYHSIKGDKYPLFWYDEEPIITDEFGEERINPIIENLNNYVILKRFVRYRTKDGIVTKQKNYKVPLPRYIQERVFTECFRTALFEVHKFRLSKKQEDYISLYGDYDISSSVPMWKQIKKTKWEFKKKSKKDELYNKNLSDILND